MMIGPEPSSRILWMSSRRGISYGLRGSAAARGGDLVDEAVEQVARVMRAGAGLRVVLDGRALDVAQPEALDRAVVEVDVGELGGAELGLPAHRLVVLDRARPARAEDGEPVVLARDLGPAGREVLDRVVGAVVTERELVGLEPDRAAEQ